ncbi:MAG: YggS family pyridoxal phosphate-dependent enzyme [Pseudomonadota bacterium]
MVSSVAVATSKNERSPSDVELIAVSKTFDADHIRPVIEAGHRMFGENRVQESQSKWPDLKQEFPDVQLHLIGPLQSNKTADAVRLFDVIQTIDREKIAVAVSKEMKKQNRHLKLFVQINTGNEPQKAGVSPLEADDFMSRCRTEHGLEVVGLMCIPPADENPGPHFALLAEIAKRNELSQLSMGMSADYEEAIAFGATHVRVGSAIFGTRTMRIHLD